MNVIQEVAMVLETRAQSNALKSRLQKAVIEMLSRPEYADLDAEVAGGAFEELRDRFSANHFYCKKINSRTDYGSTDDYQGSPQMTATEVIDKTATKTCLTCHHEPVWQYDSPVTKKVSGGCYCGFFTTPTIITRPNPQATDSCFYGETEIIDCPNYLGKDDLRELQK